MVIDAHQHYWSLADGPYEWMAADGLALLRAPHLPPDLTPELEAAGVDRTIAVQAVGRSDETSFLLSLADADETCAGVVGWVDLTHDVARQVERLRAAPGGRKLVGLRHQAQDEPDPDWLLRADVLAGLRALARAGLPFDLLIRAREMPAAHAAAERLPDTRFVIDHLAKPPIRSREDREWRAWLGRLAELPNVAAKLSGLVTEADWARWNVEDIRPYMECALELFGPARLMFGSDWPVCRLAASYGAVVDLARLLVADLPDADRRETLGGTATRWYRLDR